MTDKSCNTYWRAIFDDIVKRYRGAYSGLEWRLSHIENEHVKDSMGTIITESFWIINYLNAGNKMEWTTSEDDNCAHKLIEEARQYIAEHIAIFSRCFIIESAAIIERYEHYMLLLQNTPEDVYEDEFGNFVVTRDVVEGYLQASTLLNPQLVILNEMKFKVDRADDQFRLSALEYLRYFGDIPRPMSEEDQCRHLINSLTDSWWWMFYDR